MARATTAATLAGMSCAWLAAGAAQAGIIYLSPPQYTGDPSSGPLAAHARYRFDANNWDMLLDNDANPGQSFGRKNLGNTNQMNNVWFDFALSNTPGSGLTFQMTNRASGVTQTIAWDDDASLPSAFNTISLQSRASSSGAQSRSLLVQNLAFVAAGQSVIGSFPNLDVSSPAGSPAQFSSAFAVGNFDLSSTSWTLTGSLRPTVSGPGNPSESLRLYIDARQTNAAAVPEMQTLILTVLGAFTLPLYRRAQSAAESQQTCAARSRARAALARG